MSNVTEFTTANWEHEVLQSDLPVLVDFWAEWCGPCKAMAPHVDTLAGEMQDSLKVGKVNTDNEQHIASEFGITAIPTLLLFRGGKEIKRFVGARSLDDLRKTVQQAIGA